MLKIFNSQALTRKERFLKACVYAIPATILLSFAYAYVYSLIRIDFSMVYVGLGWLIGRLILKTGHGVHLSFSILAAVLALFCFVFSDTICVYGFWLLSRPLIFLEAMLQIFLSWFSPSMSGILSTLFRLGGIVTAFQNARIF